MDTKKFPQKIYRYETSHYDKSIGTKRPELGMKQPASEIKKLFKQ
jgi:hypothetical protein